MSEEQQSKYGALPDQTSKTAQGLSPKPAPKKEKDKK